MSGAPDLSVVLAGEDLEETAGVRALIRAQSSASRLELVLVLPASFAEAVEPADLFDGLWGGRVVRFDFSSRGTANAAGVRAASAPIVVLGEDHCYPGPRWADRLLEEHRGPWTVVGPRMRNANPGSSISWADFVIGYGPWIHYSQTGEARFLPGHNSSYKREALVAYGEGLEAMLENETALHWDLVRRGHRLLLSPRVAVRHLNFSMAGPFARSQFLNGRNFAATRAEPWGPIRRALYVLGSPLIPWVRVWRLRSAIGGRASGAAPWRVLPVLIAGLILDAAGQALGYLTASPGPKAALCGLEFDRRRFVRPSDRRALGSEVDSPA